MFDNMVMEVRALGEKEKIVGVLERIQDPELLHLILLFCIRLAERKEQA